MLSEPGKNQYSMFVNEQPEGGFKWDLWDFRPDDGRRYTAVYVSLEPHESFMGRVWARVREAFGPRMPLERLIREGERGLEPARPRLRLVKKRDR
jgi:hypothetical protein